MGNVHMEASQINYRKGGAKMSVEQALQNAKGGYDYSTDEYNTNSKWLDGSPIYGKVIELSAGDLGTSGANTKASGLENVKIIGMSGAVFNVTTSGVDYGFPLPNADGYYAQTTVGLAYDYTNNLIMMHTNNGKLSTATGYIELKYIKVTPPASSES